jgi:RNA polymerase sigma-70 factor (ECF subfamily)
VRDRDPRPTHIAGCRTGSGYDGDSVSQTAREARFRGVYEACYPDLLRFVQRRSHPSHAEDVVAEVFLVAWRRLEEMPAVEDGARCWLFGVARRSLLNSRRSQDRRQALAVRIAAAPVAAAPGGDDTDLVERRVDVAAAWPRLSATDQEALALTVWDGLTALEAARVLQISPVAFRLRLSRARRILRQHLDHPADPRDSGGRRALTVHQERSS